MTLLYFKFIVYTTLTSYEKATEQRPFPNHSIKDEEIYDKTLQKAIKSKSKIYQISEIIDTSFPLIDKAFYLLTTYPG